MTLATLFDVPAANPAHPAKYTDALLLTTAQQQLEAAQAAYLAAKQDAAFHMEGFVCECKHRKAAQ